MTTINERIDALAEKYGVNDLLEERNTSLDEIMPVDFGTKRNVKVGGSGYLLQRFPVTLYAPSWLRFLREENIDEILTFLEKNAEALSWGKD